ncbi:MAG: hypothetical protein BWX84_02589 [Verrucomicrobia bacterium ADurb.Bin118]|nr:MAG: hypothetical protein BWX84_02589 [Verrucomicrobia bacterium ADurb.Bin118]
MCGLDASRWRHATRAGATQDFFQDVEASYNRERRHSALGHPSPVVFETQVNYSISY